MTHACAMEMLDNIETGMVFRSRLEYMRNIEAVTILFADALARRNKKRTLKEVSESAVCIDNMEYLANGCRWRCRNGIGPTDVAFGTTGNEGAHFELKSWGRNITKQTLDRAKCAISFFEASKILSFMACAKFPMCANLLRQGQYVEAMLNTHASSDLARTGPSAGPIATEHPPAPKTQVKPKMTTGQLCAPTVRKVKKSTPEKKFGGGNRAAAQRLP